MVYVQWIGKQAGTVIVVLQILWHVFSLAESMISRTDMVMVFVLILMVRTLSRKLQVGIKAMPRFPHPNRCCKTCEIPVTPWWRPMATEAVVRPAPCVTASIWLDWVYPRSHSSPRTFGPKGILSRSHWVCRISRGCSCRIRSRARAQRICGWLPSKSSRH